MRRRAFGVAETLLASTIIAMILVGLYGISSSAARAAQTQMHRVAATALAEESIELLRFERERYWRGLAGGATPGRTAEGFWSYLNTSRGGQLQTSTKLSWDLTQYQSGWSDLLQGTPAGYTRQLTIETDAAALSGRATYLDLASQSSVVLDGAQAAAIAPSLLKVTVTVTWSEGGQPESYALTTYLSYWLEGML